ncbi:hypothetical protein CAS74_003906 [Pichia kudriavzevii]|uniref:RRM domain-containing protein n=1 Tax=Pichia kudriavzevii TaxID=4909 RepID=A0A1Z8JJZ7_PICKU|nr:hypothetical protein CAS74_003906 [Pichia kudriavzevii]
MEAAQQGNMREAALSEGSPSAESSEGAAASGSVSVSAPAPAAASAPPQSDSNNNLSNIMPPDLTGSSMLSARVAQSRHFAGNTPGNMANQVDNTLLFSPPNTQLSSSFLNINAMANDRLRIGFQQPLYNNGNLNMPPIDFLHIDDDDDLNNYNTTFNDITNDMTNDNQSMKNEMNNDNINQDNNNNNNTLSVGNISYKNNNNNTTATTGQITNPNNADNNDNNNNNNGNNVNNDSSKNNVNINDGSARGALDSVTIQRPTLTGSTNNSMSSNWMSTQNLVTSLNVDPWIQEQAQVMLTSSGFGTTHISQQQQSRQPHSYMKNPSPLIGTENLNTNNYGHFMALGQNYPLYNGQTSNATSATPSMKNGTSNRLQSNNNEEDELIPTAIVIKNIPFAIKKEQLLDIMSKGLAFANFNSIEETAMVVSVMNGREIDGRKLRVEYKKMLPAQERERIEREKKEKRCQLEEQHRNASSTSLASVFSASSAPPVSKNNNNNAATNNNITIHQSQSTTNIVDHPGAQGSSLNDNEQNDRSLVIFPPVDELPTPPSNMDFNNPEVLELYTRLVLFREDANSSALTFSAISLSNDGKRYVKNLCQFLSLDESTDNSTVSVRKKSTGQSTRTSPTGNQNNQLNLQQPSLMRSHSQNLVNSNPGLSFTSNRYRQHTPRSVSQNLQSGMNNLGLSVNLPTTQTSLQQQLQPQSQHQASQLHHSSSAASLTLLRSKAGLTAPATPISSRQSTFPQNSGLSVFNSNLSMLSNMGNINNMNNISNMNNINNMNNVNNMLGYSSYNGYNGYNQAQVTGGSNISMSSNRGVDQLTQGVEYLHFDTQSQPQQQQPHQQQQN